MSADLNASELTQALRLALMDAAAWRKRCDEMERATKTFVQPDLSMLVPDEMARDLRTIRIEMLLAVGLLRGRNRAAAQGLEHRVKMLEAVLARMGRMP